MVLRYMHWEWTFLLKKKHNMLNLVDRKNHQQKLPASATTTNKNINKQHLSKCQVPHEMDLVDDGWTKESTPEAAKIPRG